eukprot:scaffold96928_cov14-Tisochrysis_lutea.AAC.1
MVLVVWGWQNKHCHHLVSASLLNLSSPHAPWSSARIHNAQKFVMEANSGLAPQLACWRWHVWAVCMLSHGWGCVEHVTCKVHRTRGIEAGHRSKALKQDPMERSDVGQLRTEAHKPNTLKQGDVELATWDGSAQIKGTDAG